MTDDRESIRRLQELAEVTPDVLWMFSHDWSELLFVNSAYEEVWGRSVETLQARPEDFLEGIHPDDRERVEAEMERLSNGESTVLEYRVDPTEEYGRWVRVRGKPIRDEDGTVVRIAGFARDVTERKEREQELERKNERLAAFNRVVSHDIRNPLNVAESYLNLAREERDFDHLEKVTNALDRMEALIDDLLTLAEANERPMDREIHDLDSLARRSWQAVETADATLNVETDQSVRADRRLRRLMENVLRNAVEHGSTSNQTQSDDAVEHGSTSNQTQSDDAVEHGSTSNQTQSDDAVEHGGAGVTVTVGALDDGFYVADDGPGIPEADRDRVFETGYSTADGGTGFGLDIVQRIAEAHDWDVAVEESDAGGARFAFTGVECDP